MRIGVNRFLAQFFKLEKRFRRVFNLPSFPLKSKQQKSFTKLKNIQNFKNLKNAKNAKKCEKDVKNSENLCYSCNRYHDFGRGFDQRPRPKTMSLTKPKHQKRLRSPKNDSGTVFKFQVTKLQHKYYL